MSLVIYIYIYILLPAANVLTADSSQQYLLRFALCNWFHFPAVINCTNATHGSTVGRPARRSRAEQKIMPSFAMLWLLGEVLFSYSCVFSHFSFSGGWLLVVVLYSPATCRLHSVIHCVWSVWLGSCAEWTSEVHDSTVAWGCFDFPDLKSQFFLKAQLTDGIDSTPHTHKDTLCSFDLPSSEHQHDQKKEKRKKRFVELQYQKNREIKKRSKWPKKVQFLAHFRVSSSLLQMYVLIFSRGFIFSYILFHGSFFQICVSMLFGSRGQRPDCEVRIVMNSTLTK